jgi:hypothetical protein
VKFRKKFKKNLLDPPASDSATPFLVVTPVFFESPDIFVTRGTAIDEFAGGTLQLLNLLVVGGLCAVLEA